jgi:hypothetical protein
MNLCMVAMHRRGLLIDVLVLEQLDARAAAKAEDADRPQSSPWPCSQYLSEPGEGARPGRRADRDAIDDDVADHLRAQGASQEPGRGIDVRNSHPEVIDALSRALLASQGLSSAAWGTASPSAASGTALSSAASPR